MFRRPRKNQIYARCFVRLRQNNGNTQLRSAAPDPVFQRAVSVPVRRLRLFLPIHAAGGHAANDLCRAVFALFLLQNQRTVPVPAGRHVGLGLRHRPLPVCRPEAIAAQMARSAEPYDRHRRAVLFQIHELFHRPAQRRFGTRLARFPKHFPARRNLVFHVPVNQLHHRPVQTADRSGRPVDRLPVLSVVLPATGSRPDCQSEGFHAANPPEADRRNARNVRHGNLPDHIGSFQKSHYFGLHQFEFRRPHIRQPAPIQRIREFDGRIRLRPANLLRLLGLFGHGDRTGAAAGFSLPEELRLAV